MTDELRYLTQEEQVAFKRALGRSVKVVAKGAPERATTMTDAISEDAIAAGLEAMRETMDGECLHAQPDGSCDLHLCQCRREVKAIIAAALPLIVARERERVLRDMLYLVDNYIEADFGQFDSYEVTPFIKSYAERRGITIRSGNGGE